MDLKALVKQQYDADELPTGVIEKWEVSENAEKILYLPTSDYFIPPSGFSSNEAPQEIREHFEKLYPSKRHPLLWRLLFNGYPTHTGHGMMNSILVLDEQCAYASGERVVEVIPLIEELQPLYVHTSTATWRLEQELEQYDGRIECRGEKIGATYFDIMVHDPAYWRRRRRNKSRKSKAGRGFIMLHEFRHVIGEMRDYLCLSSKIVQQMNISPPFNDVYSRYGAYHEFTRIVTVFNLVFGTNAHRQVKAFQDLMKKWRTNGEKTKKEFKRTCNSSGMQLFLNWLDKESKVKPPPVKKFTPPRTNVWRLPWLERPGR